MKSSNLSQLVIALSILISTCTILSCKKEGCMDPNASNYKINALKEDGSCIYGPNSGQSSEISMSSLLSGGTLDSLGEFVEANKVEFEFFFIDASKGGSITTTKGTIINIQPNTFYNRVNGNFNEGSIELRIKEFYTKWDMIVNKAYTESGLGIPLESGGQLFIDALFEGEKTFIYPGKTINILMPAQSTSSGMELFSGGLNSDTAAWWNPINSAFDTLSKFKFNPPSVYDIDVSFLGWINIDKYIAANENAICKFQVANLEFNNEVDIEFCGIMKGVNSVYPMFATQKIENGKLVLTSDQILPAVPSYHLLYLVHNKQFYYTLLSEVPFQNEVNNLILKKTTSAMLQKIVEELD